MSCPCDAAAVRAAGGVALYLPRDLRKYLSGGLPVDPDSLVGVGVVTTTDWDISACRGRISAKGACFQVRVSSLSHDGGGGVRVAVALGSAPGAYLDLLVTGRGVYRKCR